MKYNPTDIARQFLYIREAATQNTGLRVESIQHWSGGNKGDSWCMEFVWMVMDICFQGQPPFDRMQACQTLYDLAKQKGWLTDKPLKGDIFLYVDSSGHAHHTGFITADGGVAGIAGNTSADGTSSNGDRVADHSISTDPTKVKYVRFPIAMQ